MAALVDIGVNLTHAAFDADRPQVIERAIAAGVSTLILTGTTVEESQKTIMLARQYPDILYSTVGVHPHDVKHCDLQTISRLREFAAYPVVAFTPQGELLRNRGVRAGFQPGLFTAPGAGILV